MGCGHSAYFRRLDLNIGLTFSAGDVADRIWCEGGQWKRHLHWSIVISFNFFLFSLILSPVSSSGLSRGVYISGVHRRMCWNLVTFLHVNITAIF